MDARIQPISRPRYLPILKALEKQLSTLCGARFGFGYCGASRDDFRLAEDMEELRRKLIDILAKDCRHRGEHKGLIEHDFQNSTPRLMTRFWIRSRNP
jgi:hypothetical protein